MSVYRCYFLRDGRISAAEVLNVETDDEARARARELLIARPSFGAVEVWQEARKICTFTAPRDPDTPSRA